MILVLILSQILLTSSSASLTSPLKAPGTVEVKAGLLHWSSAANINTTHSVEVEESQTWRDLDKCVSSVPDSCNVTALIRDAEHGCVRLRVRALSGKLQSEPVEACSVSEDRCTPHLRLSASAGSAPGTASITVHLTHDHALSEKYATHSQYRVCYRSADSPKALCQKTHASLQLQSLNPRKNYCVEVQFLLFNRPAGLPHCPVCVEVPWAESKHVGIILGVVLPVLVLALVALVAYVLIFHKKRLKAWLRPEPLPEWLALSLSVTPVCTPTVEHFSIITEFTRIDHDERLPRLL